MYDFANDTWPDGERVPYTLIHWRFLDHLYQYARIPGNFNSDWGTGWDRYEQQSEFAYEKIAPSLQRPVEKLMIEIVVLLLAAGRQLPSFDEFHRNKIAAILDDSALEDLMSMLGHDERREFRDDLAIVQT